MKELSFEERLMNLTKTVGPASEVEETRKAINSVPWIFAKTYAAFCPHEYTLRRDWKKDRAFRKFVSFIWKYGMDAQYGKTSVKRYWFDYEGGYYYFLDHQDCDQYGKTAEKLTLINRGKIEYFDFWVEEDLLGQWVRCKVRPGAPRKAQIEHGLITA